MSEKTSSCGILIQCGQRYLLVHATNENAPLLVDDARWGYPKGKTDDEDVDPKATAIRELREETGICLRHAYKHIKELTTYETDTKIFTAFKYIDDSQKLMNHKFYCDSKFIDANEVEQPEVDRFYWADKTELEEIIAKEHKKQLFPTKKKEKTEDIIDV